MIKSYNEFRRVSKYFFSGNIFFRYNRFDVNKCRKVLPVFFATDWKCHQKFVKRFQRKCDEKQTKSFQKWRINLLFLFVDSWHSIELKERSVMSMHWLLRKNYWKDFFAFNPKCQYLEALINQRFLQIIRKSWISRSEWESSNHSFLIGLDLSWLLSQFLRYICFRKTDLTLNANKTFVKLERLWVSGLE